MPAVLTCGKDCETELEPEVTYSSACWTRVMVDADVVVLETVIGTGELMPLFAEGSCATAVSVWLPLESAVVSNKIEYGVDVSLAPTFAPSTWNCTNETALSESVAVAASVMVPDTVALFDGAVMVTTGGVVSVVTVKLTLLLAVPPTVTTTLPVVAPLGTGTAMLVALQLVGVPAVPLNLTVLVPCVVPKFAPLIVTGVPAIPEVGLRLVMLGGAAPAPALNDARRAPQ